MINLTRLLIKKPIIVNSIIMLILVFGVFSITKIKRAYLPATTLPIVNMTIQYPGASALMVQNLAVKPIENEIRTISNIQYLFISSYPGMAIIRVQFPFGLSNFELNEKLENIKTKINQVIPDLPSQVKPPQASLLTVNQTPVAWVLFRSKTKDMIELTHTIDQFSKQLITNPSVGGAELLGTVDPTIEVKLSPSLMSAYGVTIDLIYNAIAKEYSQVPGNEVQQGGQSFALNLNPTFKNLEQLKNTIVTYRNNAPVYLKQVASIHLQNEAKSNLVYWGGKPAIALNVLATINQGAIPAINETTNLLNELKTGVLKNVQYQIFFSQKELINSTIHDLLLTLIFSFIFTSIVVFLYLGKIRASFIVLTAIPISLMSTVIVMLIFKLSFNMITLLSMILLAGLVVDDAIVIVENYDYFKKNNPNQNREELVISSLKSIISSIVTYTLSLILVFSSVIFMSGMTKVMFADLVNIVIPGIIFSFLVSILITPCLCYHMKEDGSNNKISNRLFSIIEKGESYYANLLDSILKNRKKMGILLVAFILPSILILPNMGQDFMPPVNNGRVQATYLMTGGYDNEQTKKILEQTFKKMSSYVNINSLFSISDTGFSNQGSFYIEDPAFSKLGTKKEISLLQNLFAKTTNMRIAFSPPPVTAGQNPEVLRFSIAGNNFLSVYNTAYQILNLLEQDPKLGIFTIDTPRLLTSYQLEINPELMAKMGFNAEEIKQMVSLYGGGITATQVYYQDKNYNIILYPESGTLSTPEDLEKIYAFNPKGEFIKVAALARLKLDQSPMIINSSLNGYSVTLGSTPAENLNIAMKQVKDIVTKNLPKDMTFSFIGTTVQLKKTLKTTAIALGISLFLLYFLLVFQFNSFIMPLVLFIAQLLGICGAIYALFLTGLSINLYSLIAIFLLIGLVTKNSILVVSLSNQYMKEGKNAEEAIKLACTRRAKPVLMTSSTIILAMLPVLFIYDANRIAQLSLSVPIMAGMLVSTLLTLVFLPLLYLYVKGRYE